MNEDLQNTSLIKVTTGLARIEKQIAVTNKLLATIEPILIPYRKKDKWGYCTPDKKIIIGWFRSAEPFSEGLAAVQNDRWGCINKAGKLVIPFKYNYIQEFSEGLALVQATNAKCGYINKTGEVVIPFKYEYSRTFSEGLAIVINEKCGFINKTGDEVIPLKYDAVYHYGFSEGLAAVQFNGEWAFINQYDKVVIPFKKYDEVFYYGFKEGSAAVKLNEKWGYINKAGQVIIPFRYNFAQGFSEGLAAVQINGKWGYISADSEVVIPFKYDGVFYYGFKEGLTAVELNGKWGYINKVGEIVIPFKYYRCYSFSGGIAKVELKETRMFENKKEGYIDKDGIEYWED